MRVKKDKAYVIVSVEKGYIQGAFPYTETGKKLAYAYLKDLTNKKKKEESKNYKIKVM